MLKNILELERMNQLEAQACMEVGTLPLIFVHGVGLGPEELSESQPGSEFW
jgi:hypothetical protein